jgi:dienelactone hydrolase
MIRLVSAFVLVAAIGTAAGAQQFNISPAEPVLLGTPLAITLSGLPAGKEVRITAERVMFSWTEKKRTLYRSDATFATDANGSVDLTRAAPKRGSYTGVDPRGLFWSMTPLPDAPQADRRVLEVRLTAGTDDNPAMAKGTITFLDMLPNVKTEKVDAFPGAVFAAQSGGGKRPAVIILGGSEGGSAITRSAAPLASHGYAVLALPYYSPPDWQTQKAELPALPPAFADIPVNRLNEARAWLQAREDVDGTRIALYGTSKGAEFVLLAGVHLGWATAIVAEVPSDVVWEGWGMGVESGKRSSFAVDGKPLPFVPYKAFNEEFLGFQTGSPIHIRRPQDRGRADNPAAAVAARIPVERIKAPVLVLGGHDDLVWASGMMAQNIAERRAEAKLDTVALIYSDAGHYLGGTGYNPTTQYNADPIKSGGTPAGNAAAQADAHPKILAFLKRTLAK